MTLMTPRSLALLASVSLLAACTVDNSGGPPPEGDSISFTQLDLTDADFMCGAYGDDAAIISDEATVDEWLAGCFDEDPSEMRDHLLTEIDALADDESLIVADVVLGGCTQDFELLDVAIDDEIVRPWIVKHDTSYGKQDVACTADIGEQILLLKIADDRAATAAELHIGVYNPELPGGPVTIQ